MIDNHGGGPGHGQRGQISSLSIKSAIDASAAAMISCAASVFVICSAAIFELTAATRNWTDHGTGSGLNASDHGKGGGLTARCSYQ